MPVRLKGVAGGTLLLSFALLIALLVTSAVVSYLNVQSMVRNFDWLEHSYEILLVANRTSANMTSIQNAARGYVITGDPELVKDYHTYRRSVARNLGELYDRTSDNEPQQRILREIPPLLTQRYERMDEGIRRRAHGLPQRTDPMWVQTGLEVQNRIDGKLDQFRANEQKLLDMRSDANKRSRSAVDISFWAMTGIAALALIGFYGMVARAVQAEATRTQDLENEVALRTSELVAANRDLESFSYSVSHDLRAPLRAVGSFARVLQEDASTGLSDENNETLDRIVEGCHRMSQLIDALLNLSRLSRTELEVTDVNLSELADTVLQEVASHDLPQRVRIEVEPDLTVRGDSTLLRLLLTNLASNASKFSLRSPDPIIRFGHETNGGEACFFVADNGIGFDSERAKELFEPFHRFHSFEDYPGTGIGLAICARIVRRHGGRIWAESRPGQGAKFLFTLGQQPAKREKDAEVSARMPDDLRSVS